MRIWDRNASREFLNKNGFYDRAEGDLGPIYGFQWRHYGAEYVDMHTDYTNCGIDQLRDVICKIKTNPTDRRLLMTAWNPLDLCKMALPPCHCLVQFYVCDNELSCLFYQRSADIGLGVPFNMASYALLTHMIAHVCGLKPGELIHMMGDTHVYLNHVDVLEQQLTREPRDFPKLIIRTVRSDIDDFCAEDFDLVDYDPHPPLRMEMAL